VGAIDAGVADATVPPSMEAPPSSDADGENAAPEPPTAEPQAPDPVLIELSAPIQYYKSGHGDWIDGPMKLCSAVDLRAYYETYRQDLDMYTTGYDSGAEIPQNDSERKIMFDVVFGNEKYNEAYFADHFLLFIYITEPSGSNRERVDSVVVENGALTVGITRLQAHYGTCDMAYWTIIMELDKEWEKLDVRIDVKKELWLPGVELPDTPGASEGRDPYDEAYQKEVCAAALDAMWRGDKEELGKYVLIFPYDAESVISRLEELRDFLPPESGALTWPGDQFAQYPLSDGRVLMFNPVHYSVVNRQVKLSIDFYAEG